MTAPVRSEIQALAECEAIIERGLATFVEVGEALLRIRDARLYRDSHGTFEDYCRERWGFSRQTGYDLMTAAETAGLVQEVGQTPTREQARELAPLRKEPEALREAWSDAVERHGSAPTAKQVREVVRREDDSPELTEPEPAARPEPPWAQRMNRLAEALLYVASHGDAPDIPGRCKQALEVVHDVWTDLERMSLRPSRETGGSDGSGRVTSDG